MTRLRALWIGGMSLAMVAVLSGQTPRSGGVRAHRDRAQPGRPQATRRPGRHRALGGQWSVGGS